MLKPIFTDPFAGKCVHGVPGARFENGIKVNPQCPQCVKHGTKEVRNDAH